MIMAIVHTSQLTEDIIQQVYCYSVDSTKAVITYDGIIDNLALLEYNQLSELLITPEWKQPEDTIL
jgi:hypothetical protein